MTTIGAIREMLRDVRGMTIKADDEMYESFTQGERNADLHDVIAMLDQTIAMVEALETQPIDWTKASTRNVPAEFVAAALFQQVNGWGSGFEKAMVKAFQNEHPTLQQGLFRNLILPILSAMAATSYTDARNDGSKRFARAAIDATKDIGLPLI